MRIIAGERKGYSLAAPPGKATRPTLGRVRESLFSILAAEIPGAKVLDLYAGAGGLGLEALSRGAEFCVFVEKSRGALETLRRNIQKLHYEDRAKIISTDAASWLRRCNSTEFDFDLIFSDPPYVAQASDKTLQTLDDCIRPDKEPVIVLQTCSREPVSDQVGRLRRYRMEKYGDSALHFFALESGDADASD